MLSASKDMEYMDGTYIYIGHMEHIHGKCEIHEEESVRNESK